jgi:hypothetical protein
MATLPSYVRVLFDGYNEQKESGILRTEFESGPPRQARFKSRTMKTRQASLFIETKANFQAFETWFADDLEQGALFFNMTDPIRGTTIEARFVGGVYSAEPMSAKLDLWRVSCQIESWGS